MKSATEYLTMRTAKPREFVNLTERVRAIVRASGVHEGLVLVSAMHITAAVYVNDNEPGLIGDIERWADRLAPPATTPTTGPGSRMATPISRTSSWGTRSSCR